MRNSQWRIQPEFWLFQPTDMLGQERRDGFGRVGKIALHPIGPGPADTTRQRIVFGAVHISEALYHRRRLVKSGGRRPLA